MSPAVCRVQGVPAIGCRPGLRLSLLGEITKITVVLMEVTGVDQLLSISMFLVPAIGFVLVALTVGRLFRPNRPNSDKKEIYECGEPTIGTGWVQFNLRFYIVALFYLVFDVEVALIYPWAAAYRHMENVAPALLVATPFVLIIVVGYAYEWYAGSLDWVRGTGASMEGDTAGVDICSLASDEPKPLDDKADTTAAEH